MALDADAWDKPQWRKVPDWPDYSVSHTGVVRNDKRQVDLVPAMFDRVTLQRMNGYILEGAIFERRQLWAMVWPEVAQ